MYAGSLGLTWGSKEFSVGSLLRSSGESTTQDASSHIVDDELSTLDGPGRIKRYKVTPGSHDADHGDNSPKRLFHSEHDWDPMADIQALEVSGKLSSHDIEFAIGQAAIVTLDGRCIRIVLCRVKNEVVGASIDVHWQLRVPLLDLLLHTLIHELDVIDGGRLWN
ncbi:hypothetical protein HG531_010784 [Fusarium graminearum]|nr:hypothetical protein HG531_010784 [Fusarium graminearum]